MANLRAEYARSIEPARTLAAEALRLEHQLSDLVNEAYGLSPDEVALLWQTAPPRMPVPSPVCLAGGDEYNDESRLSRSLRAGQESRRGAFQEGIPVASRELERIRNAVLDRRYALAEHDQLLIITVYEIS